MSERNFHKDFLQPAITGLRRADTLRVAKALDAAIAFGALEHAQGNGSLQDTVQVEARYWALVMELKKL